MRCGSCTHCWYISVDAVLNILFNSSHICEGIDAIVNVNDFMEKLLRPRREHSSCSRVFLPKITVKRASQDLALQGEEYHFDFGADLPPAREKGHKTGTFFLQRLMEAAYPNGVRYFPSGPSYVNTSAITNKMLKLGTCGDSGVLGLPPAVQQNLGNHKAFSTSMIYQSQQQQCLKTARAGLLAPMHLLALPGNRHGVPDVDVSVRLLHEEIKELKEQVLQLMGRSFSQQGACFPGKPSQAHAHAPHFHSSLVVLAAAQGQCAIGLAMSALEQLHMSHPDVSRKVCVHVARSPGMMDCRAVQSTLLMDCMHLQSICFLDCTSLQSITHGLQVWSAISCSPSCTWTAEACSPSTLDCSDMQSMTSGLHAWTAYRFGRRCSSCSKVCEMPSRCTPNARTRCIRRRRARAFPAAALACPPCKLRASGSSYWRR